jgi:hypothetical protein
MKSSLDPRIDIAGFAFDETTADAKTGIGFERYPPGVAQVFQQLRQDIGQPFQIIRIHPDLERAGVFEPADGIPQQIGHDIRMSGNFPADHLARDGQAQFYQFFFERSNFPSTKAFQFGQHLSHALQQRIQLALNAFSPGTFALLMPLFLAIGKPAAIGGLLDILGMWAWRIRRRYGLEASERSRTGSSDRRSPR